MAKQPEFSPESSVLGSGPGGAVSLSPREMVDSVADWPLHRVIEHLRKKEKDDKEEGRLSSDCRMFCRTGIALFDSVVDELATQYGVTKGRMSRWMSYHGVAIAQSDALLGELSVVGTRVRRLALAENSADIASLNDSVTPYSPHDLETRTPSSFYLYGPWVMATFSELARVCGVYPGQVAQLFIMRSALTSDLPTIAGATERLQCESERWDKWMRWRARALEAAIEIWGSV